MEPLLVLLVSVRLVVLLLGPLLMEPLLVLLVSVRLVVLLLLLRLLL